MKFSLRSVILVLCLISSEFASGEDCENESYLLCYSSQMIRNLFARLDQSRQPLVIFPGVEIVPTANSAKETDNSIDSTNDSIIGMMSNYLEHHEIAIKLSDLLDTNKLLQFIGGETKENHSISGRKKDNKMYMVAISLMFGKLLAVLGIGSIGTLAMKALGVASMALLVTGILGLKNLYQGNEQSSHHVQYVSEGHHRRRRQVHPKGLIPLPYRGWMKTSAVQLS